LNIHWITPFILLAEDALDFGPEIIKTAERLNKWQPANVLNQNKKNIRTNEIVLLSRKISPKFEKFENELHQIVIKLAKEYIKQHPIKIAVDLGYDLLKYSADQYYSFHIDNPLTFPHIINRQLSIVFSLNDDYEGGELYFPKHNLNLKLKAGSAIVFPSNFCYLHASLKIIKGIKANI